MRVSREHLSTWVVKANPALWDHVPLRGTRWWRTPVTIDECRADPVLRGIEVLSAPRSGNPSYLTQPQAAALDEVRGA